MYSLNSHTIHSKTQATKRGSKSSHQPTPAGSSGAERGHQPFTRQQTQPHIHGRRWKWAPPPGWKTES